MKILVIEDENSASRRLVKMIKEVEPNVQVLDILESIEASVQWFSSHPCPDLVFMDIQLADGICFEIFKKTEVHCPVIFTTALDKFAMDAFKVNSIDYLLKPIRTEEIRNSFKKLKMLQSGAASIDYRELLNALQGKKDFQKRFLIQYREHIRKIEVEDISYFFTEEKVVFLCTRDGKQYPVDYSLEKLEEILDPERFFRINRQFIVALDAIDEMHTWSKSRVKLELVPPFKGETIVSTEKSPVFKQWLTGAKQ